MLRSLTLFGFLVISMTMASLLPATPAESKKYRGSYPYKVVATTGMVADLVRSIAQEKAEVTQLIGASVDPHLYSPARDDIAALLRSNVIFYNGLFLEGRMTDALERAGSKRLTFAVTERIGKGTLLDYPGKGEGHADPHVWMDVALWMQAAEAVANQLAYFDPTNHNYYLQNSRTLISQMNDLHAYAKESLSTIPEERRVMITAHDAFSYMETAYGIEVHGIQGLSTESEAGLKDINKLVDLIVSRQIPAIFVETSVSDKNVRALIEGAKARGHEVSIGGSLFSDAMGKVGTYEGTYLGMIDHNVTTITRALGGSAPKAGWQGKLATAAGQAK